MTLPRRPGSWVLAHEPAPVVRIARLPRPAMGPARDTASQQALPLRFLGPAAYRAEFAKWDNGIVAGLADTETETQPACAPLPYPGSGRARAQAVCTRHGHGPESPGIPEERPSQGGVPVLP